MAGLFDYEFQLDEIKKHQPPLQKLNEIIDWVHISELPDSDAGVVPDTFAMRFSRV